jgi:hypothetical protein
MICASLYRAVFIKNLLRYLAEKILLLNTTNFRGDYRTKPPFAVAAIADAAFVRDRSIAISVAQQFSPNRPLPAGFEGLIQNCASAAWCLTILTSKRFTLFLGASARMTEFQLMFSSHLDLY